MDVTGLPVHITEYWAHTNHLKDAGMPADEIAAAQSEYVINCMTCAFGSPAVDAFFCWGMMKDLLDIRGKGVETAKLYHDLETLIHSTWRTNETLTTSADGVVDFRGFHGDYSLRITPTGGTQTAGTTFQVPVGSDPLSLSLRVPHQTSA